MLYFLEKLEKKKKNTIAKRVINISCRKESWFIMTTHFVLKSPFVRFRILDFSKT